MQTEQIISRDFMGLQVRQKHLTKVFCANDLFDIFKSKNPTTKKTLQGYLDNESTKEYIDHMIQTERIAANHVYTSTRGSKGGSWFHPYLMIDFAMWLDPEFKFKVTSWVFDNLCHLRDAAGDDFKDLMQVIKDEIEPEKHWIYTNEIRLIQGLAGVETGERNQASTESLHKLDVLQKADIKLIRQGMHEYQDRKKRLIALAEML